MIDLSTGKEMTRREFGVGLSAILASGVAPSITEAATGARRGLGMRTGMMGGTAVREYDVQDYVGWGTSSMVLFCDGIRNVGATSEHSSSANAWTDLVTNAVMSVTGSASWGASYRTYAGGCEHKFVTSEMVSAFNNQNFTIEFIVHPNAGTGVDWLCIGNSSGSIRERLLGNTNASYYLQNAPGYKVVWTGPSAVGNTSHFCFRQFNSTSGSATLNGSTSLFTRDFNAPTWSTSERFVIANEPGFIGRADYVLRGNVYAVRMYGRALTDSEIAANYAIDKARFGI